ncbi:MAG: hypothetical protein K0R67_1675, partial [Paenibacillus sp.]|nr:hypothetical protein [Paenibacillus sp.]
AAAADPAYAHALITGPYNDLAVGSNMITIQVTAENQLTKLYTITINRENLAAPIITNISTNPTPAVPTKNNVLVTAAVAGNQITAFKWLPGNVGIEAFTTAGSTLTAAGFEASDNGTYTLYALNQVGGYDLKTVTVQNIDRTPPIIELVGSSSITITQAPTGSYQDQGYKQLSDNMDSTEQLTVTHTSEVNGAQIGTYTYSYTASDRAGNSTTVTRTVNVIRALSSNNELSSIVSQGHTLNFLPSITDYTLHVPYEVTSLPLFYSVADSTATVMVSDSVYQASANTIVAELRVGPNEVEWQVTAENGNTKRYRLIITRMSSTNAYIQNFIFQNNGGVLSQAFNSDVNEYDVYVPGSSNLYSSVLTLSDPMASFTVTGVTYTVTGVTYSTTVTGITYNPSYILFDFGSATSFVITVTAADHVTQKHYNFKLLRVPAATINPIGYSRMMNAQTLQLRFQHGVAADNLLLLNHIVVNGAQAVVTGLRSVYTGSETVVLEVTLSEALSSTSSLSISILPGLLKSVPSNQSITQLHIPIVSLAATQQLYETMDIHQDGLHVEDVLRYIGSPTSFKDFNGDGVYDRNDLLFLLSLIGHTPANTN